jgi:hypothetical protein
MLKVHGTIKVLCCRKGLILGVHCIGTENNGMGKQVYDQALMLLMAQAQALILPPQRKC